MDNNNLVYVFSGAINIEIAALETRQKIQSQKEYLILQGKALTDEHFYFHQVMNCNCVTYNVKIKLINTLITALDEILEQTNLENDRETEAQLINE